MEYTKLKYINEYQNESINPSQFPETEFEMYSVPSYDTWHPEYVIGKDIGSSKILVQKNDILLCKINPRINRVWIVSDESDKQNIASSEWIVIRNHSYNPEYLAWYFRSKFFQNYMTSEVTGIGGSLTRAQPKRVGDYPVPVLSREEQDNIVKTLNTLQKVVNAKKEELNKCDYLIKARFVEMFGLPGDDNPEWKFGKLGDVCEFNPKKVNNPKLVNNPEVSFVPMNAVSEKGYLDPSEIRSYSDVKTGFTYFEDNDVLFAKITPCMENGKGAVAKGLKNGVGFGSTEFHVLRPVKGVSNPYWIYTLTSFEQFRIQAMKNMTGSAGQRRVPVNFLENYRVAIPPIELQDRFADFVAQVDKSKAAVQKSLDETQLLFDSLMQKYFG